MKSFNCFFSWKKQSCTVFQLLGNPGSPKEESRFPSKKWSKFQAPKTSETVSCTFSLIMSFMSMMSFFFSWLRGHNKSRVDVSHWCHPIPTKVETPKRSKSQSAKASPSASPIPSVIPEKTARCLGKGDETDGIETFAEVLLDSLWIPGRHQKLWTSLVARHCVAGFLA